jgi:hypothetical protein
MTTRQNLFLAVMFLFFFGVAGEGMVVYNPDENTLWIEDGKDVEQGTGSSDKHWSEGLEMESTEKGLRVKSPSSEKHGSGRYLKLSPEYPYLVWEITEVNYGKGYRGLGFYFPSGVFGFVSHIYPGIFVANPFLSQKDLKEGTKFCRIYLYNTEIYLKYIKMVKSPENLIDISSPVLKDKGYVENGDELTFRIILKKPCEDVTLTFYHSYITSQVSMNGMSTLQLKPEDKEQKVWSNTIKISSIGRGNLGEKKSYDPGSFLIKATVLGGEINVPLWTANWFEIKLPEGK